MCRSQILTLNSFFPGLGRQRGLRAGDVARVQAGPPSGRLQGAQDRLPGVGRDPLHRLRGGREEPDDLKDDLRGQEHHRLQASGFHKVPEHRVPGSKME